MPVIESTWMESFTKAFSAVGKLISVASALSSYFHLFAVRTGNLGKLSTIIPIKPFSEILLSSLDIVHMPIAGEYAEK